MKYTFILILTLFVISAFQNQVKAQDKVLTIVAFDIPNVLSKDGSGKYDQILKEIERNTGIKFTVKVLPIARARNVYANGQFDCLIPLDVLFENQHTDHLQSLPFYKANLYAFTKTGTKPITDMKELKDLRVGGEIGIPYTEEINKLIGMNKATNLKNLVKMLEHDRFDAIIAYTPDILEVFEHEKMVPFSYDPKHPLVIYNDSLTCRPTDRNSELLNEINHALLKILK
jgi:polar amino acid transport system substrate-binding protein